MGPLNLVLWLAGVALIAVGYTRARRPWQRLQALKEEDRNAERYSAWRGGVRASGSGPTGASVAMEILRRQARTGAIFMGVGFLLVLAGFAIR
jgi:hypothetical protein